MWAISTAFTVRSSQPPRILIVNSTPIALRIVRNTTAAPSGSRIRAEPWPFVTIFATGQPMLRSIASAPVASSRRAASASTSGSAPSSWSAIGCSSGKKRANSAVRALPSRKPRASISSLVSGPAPHSRAISLKGALVTAGHRGQTQIDHAVQHLTAGGGYSTSAMARTGEPSAPSSFSGSAMKRQRAAPIWSRLVRYSMTVMPAGKKIACVVYSDAARSAPRLGDRVADAVVRRVVVADGLRAAGDQPLAGARAGPRRLPSRTAPCRRPRAWASPCAAARCRRGVRGRRAARGPRR